MPVGESIEKGPGAACHACGKSLPADTLICAACGAAHGESNRCPHCNVVADVEPHPSLGFRCRVCGGPRVPLDVAGVTLGQNVKAALEGAGREHSRNLAFSAVGFLLTGMGGVAFLVAAVLLLAASPGLLPILATLFACSVPVVAGLTVLGRAARARTLRGQALHLAQVSALSDIQAVTGVLDAGRAAQVLRIAPEQAELLLAEASVGALLGEAPPPRVRVTEASEAFGVETSTELGSDTDVEPRRTEN